MKYLAIILLKVKGNNFERKRKAEVADFVDVLILRIFHRKENFRFVV